MVLVDSSVWIRALSNRAEYAGYKAELDRLLVLDQVASHDLVYGELLVGDRGGRRELLALHERYAQAPVVPHDDVVTLVHSRNLHGRGAGWIDMHLLASALVAHMPLWTADEPLLVLAQELNIAYKPR
jgi:predicted nucleic acid-binding protein